MLRLVTWNCRVGGFRYKAKHVCTFRPDVLAVQEVEPLHRVLSFAGECQPTFRDRLADPRYPRRAIGVFSFTEAVLEAADLEEPSYSFRRHVVQHGDLEFQVASVWTYGTRLKATSYRQAHEGLRKHEQWFRAKPTVVLGDFNANASFKGDGWSSLMQIMEALDLVSAYHCFFREPFGAESRPTHFHKGKEGSTFHLDYCFIPRPWANLVHTVRVGNYEDWREVSDHVPLIVDLNL